MDNAVKGAILDLAERHRTLCFSIVETLHANPETGLKEFESSKLLSGILEQEGFAVERGVAGMPTAFRASLESEGPSIAILAEMDALPLIGHACGHNIIAAAAVGAALILRDALPREMARITVFGAPAEEMGIGKVDMVRSGCFDDVNFAMMVHPSSRRQVIKMSLGLAKVRFTFLGKAAHAAAHPEEGVNALDAVLLMFSAVNALRQQFRQDVRVHGIITEGGVAPNIIPERAACYYYIRAEDLAEVEAVKRRVMACAEGAALGTGCRLEMEEDPRVLAPLKVNRSFSALYSRQLEYLHLPEANGPSDKNRGSSDIGNVSQVVPTIHPHVPIGVGIHIHTDGFARAAVSNQGKAAALEGATAMALTAAELAYCADIRKKIVDEFNASLV